VGPRRLAWLAIPALALACGGCGNARNHATGLAQLGPPISLVDFSSANGDVSFGRPSTWSVNGGPAPEVAQISSGGAVATVWAYPRTDLAQSLAGAVAARQRLVASLHRRSPGFVVESSRVRKVDGAYAVEIVGHGRIAGHPVKTQSVHVYKGAAEYVIDAYARPKLFRQAKVEAFDPMLATLRVGGFPNGAPSGGVTAPG
jgi:hypothetical protein